MKAQDIIDLLELEPLLPEGGFVRNTYRRFHAPDTEKGAGNIYPCTENESEARKTGEKPAGSAIYYLLRGDDFSHMHCLKGDEIYHFYLGDPVELVELLPDGSARVAILGSDIEAGEEPQHLVPAGNWQGSRRLSGGEYGFSLLGTTMWPGYTDRSYSHGVRRELLARWPEAEKFIIALTAP